MIKELLFKVKGALRDDFDYKENFGELNLGEIEPGSEKRKAVVDAVNIEKRLLQLSFSQSSYGDSNNMLGDFIVGKEQAEIINEREKGNEIYEQTYGSVSNWIGSEFSLKRKCGKMDFLVRELKIADDELVE